MGHIGNSRSVYAMLGASNHAINIREHMDYYATEPKALEDLLKHENFSSHVWECACGAGHLSEVLINRGYNVRNTDIVDRGFNNTEVKDFLGLGEEDIDRPRDIITNPPYKYAREFIEKALEISTDGTKIAMLLRLQFLEGKRRREFFEKFPPVRIYVFSRRVMCAKNGDFELNKKIGGSAVAYAWFIWIKGTKQEPTIKWL